MIILQLTYDCAAPPSTEFDIAVGPMASAAGAPRVCSLRTIKSDVVVGLGPEGNTLAEKLDKEEPGWKISGKYVSILVRRQGVPIAYHIRVFRLSSSCRMVGPAKRSASHRQFVRGRAYIAMPSFFINYENLYHLSMLSCLVLDIRASTKTPTVAQRPFLFIYQIMSDSLYMYLVLSINDK